MCYDVELWPSNSLLVCFPRLHSWIRAGPFLLVSPHVIRASHTLCGSVSKSFPMHGFVLWWHCSVCLLHIGYSEFQVIVSKTAINTNVHLWNHVYISSYRSTYKLWAESAIISTAKDFSKQVHCLKCHQQPWACHLFWVLANTCHPQSLILATLLEAHRISWWWWLGALY